MTWSYQSSVPGARVEHDQRIRVAGRAGERAAVRPLGRATPRRRIRVPGVEPAVSVDRDRIPEPAAAGLERIAPRLLDRHELPAHRTRRRVQRVDRAAPERRVPDRAHEDESVPDDRRDVDELLARAREVTAPELSAGAGRERERVGVRSAVDAPAVDRQPVRPVVRARYRCAQRSVAVRAIERVHVAVEILDVDRFAVGDRGRREDARVRRCGRQSESPAHLETRGVSGVDGRSDRSACAGEIGVGKFPGAVGWSCVPQPERSPATTAATATRSASCRSRSHRRCYPIDREVAPYHAGSGVRRGARAGRSRLWSSPDDCTASDRDDQGHDHGCEDRHDPEARAAGRHGSVHPDQPRCEAPHVQARSRTTWNRDADRLHQGSQAERSRPSSSTTSTTAASFRISAVFPPTDPSRA